MPDLYQTDPSLLKKVQKAATGILAELDRVCRQLEIRYCVYGGTAIGTVRHKGFIPWDDDVDVCMPRPDYERFLVLAPTVLEKKYVLKSQHNDQNYPKTFAVLGLRGTQFTPAAASGRPYPMPLGIDVFPLDRMPRQRKDYLRQNRRTWVWGRLLFLLGSANAQTGLTGLTGAGVQALLKAIHASLRFSHVTPAFLYRRWEKAARKFEGSDSPIWADYSTQDPLRWSEREDELFPVLRAPFADITVNLPHAYDRILRRGYGDYLALPPVSQRVNHAPIKINLGADDEA